MDTLVMSRMLWSNISDIDWSTKPKDMPIKLYGSHSLKAWGYRLGELKDEYKGCGIHGMKKCILMLGKM